MDNVRLETRKLRQVARLSDPLGASNERQGGTSLVPKYGKSRLITAFGMGAESNQDVERSWWSV